MALPTSGTISLSQVNVELNKSASATISLGDSAVRTLAGKPSGTISMSDLYGKAFEVRFVNTVNRTQANIYTLMGSPTVATHYIFENTATISAASQSGWALQTGTFPAGSTLTIINRGHIRGGGGGGGDLRNTAGAGGNGGAGGTALILNFPTTIDNTTGTIWGGGGGGGYGVDYSSEGIWGGGGGAGIPGGAGGIPDGKNGTATSGGAGGGSGGDSGGTGGGPGSAGANPRSGSRGGRGGYSVQTNSNAVTWIAVGDRRGSVV